MRKLVQLLVGVMICTAMTPVPAAAQAKIRVALWEFESNAERHWWFWNDLGPAARNQIDTAFSNNKTLSDMFTVVERQKLDLIMKEQGLSTAGALDPQMAAKVGKILGIRYIITGGIDKFAINKTGGAIGRFGVGGQMVTANAVINVRIIDTTTAERVVSVAAEGEVKKGGGFFKGTSLSRDAEWGIASEAVEKASQNVVVKLTEAGTLDRIKSAAGSNLTAAGMEAKIAKVDGNRAYLTLGGASGIKVGDKFVIWNIGEAIVDPDTGQKLGADEKQVGEGTVTDVQERFAIITFTGKVSVRDAARKK